MDIEWEDPPDTAIATIPKPLTPMAATFAELVANKGEWARLPEAVSESTLYRLRRGLAPKPWITEHTFEIRARLVEPHANGPARYTVWARCTA